VAPPPGALTLRQAWPLHGRADDAVAALASRGEDGRFVRAGCLTIRNDDQLPLFPKALAALQARLCERDLFLTVNGTAGRNWTDAGVRRLNAVWVDLDGHRLGLTPGQILDAMHDELRNNRVPPWSLMALSGRGVWFLWCLRDPAAGIAHTPPSATPENVAIVQNLNNQLARRLAHLGADSKATNAGRLMRAPGSVNTKTDVRVFWYYAAAGDLDAIPLYTLEGFACGAGLEISTAPHQHPGTAQQRAAQTWKKPKPKPRGTGRRFDSQRAKAAAARRFRGPLDEVLALIQHRGGLHEGTREVGLWTLGHLAATAQWTLDQALVQARATRTFPSLCPRRAEYQTTRGWEMGREATGPLGFETVAAKLELTRQEADALGLDLLTRALPKLDACLDAFVAFYKAQLATNKRPPTLRTVCDHLAHAGYTTKRGRPLSLDTLAALRARAVRAGRIPREVRLRSVKDRQLRLVVENPPTQPPNPSVCVDPGASDEAVFSQKPA